MCQNEFDSSIISAVSFGLYNPNELLSSSVCEIKNTLLTKFGMPAKEGLMDPRLGTISRSYICETCNQTSILCPGHFGHIKLSEPLFHIGYIGTINKILKCICLTCGRLKACYSEKEFQEIILNYRGKERFKRIVDLCSTRKKCEYIKDNNSDVVDNIKFWRELGVELKAEKYRLLENNRNKEPCSHDIPLFSLDKTDQKFHLTEDRGKGNGVDIITASKVLEILKQICETDIYALGFNPKRNRPEWMILTILPVPPPHVRPPVKLDNGNSVPDDISNKLGSIIQSNNILNKLKQDGEQSIVISEFADILQWHLTTYFVNDRPSIKRSTTKNGKPIKTIAERLKGKDGHIRGNLNGKRVDFSARSVISPDPNIRIDQVGVPESIAKTLTFPEYVTSKNRIEMQKLVENGPDSLDGANYIITPKKMTINLSIAKDRSSIYLDDMTIVERHLRDGDVVVFNRQPSLHKMSMMGHHALIMPGSTFRLNLSVTTPYNADFDGDEMNMHVPQSQAARAEVKHIMLVPNQIISPQGNKPIIGLVQDSLLASRLMTYKNVFINRSELMNLMMFMNGGNRDIVIPTPCIMMPKKGHYLWSGKQVFSMIMPKVDLEYNHSDDDSWLPLKDSRLVIRDGEILLGSLDKDSLGKSNKSLTQNIINLWGKEAARDFLSISQMITNNWIESRGFSIGLIDAVAKKKTINNVFMKLLDLENDVKDIISDTLKGNLTIQPGMTLKESFEMKVNGELNNAIGSCGKLVKQDARFWNSLHQMVDAGSKGNMVNISQIIATVGQQNIEGKRIRCGFKDRTLPHFTKYDFGLESRGFCRHSYLQGLSPTEFFFHSMAGREGIIDTACKTADTGYIQRRLCKSMESHSVQYDGTVRNSLNEIIQFLYGGDGLDPTALETQKLSLVTMDDDTFNKKYHFDFTKLHLFGKGAMTQDAIDSLLSDFYDSKGKLEREETQLRDFQNILRNEIFLDGSNSVWLPINISRLIKTAQHLHNIHPRSDKSPLNPVYVIEKVKSFVDELVIVKGNETISIEAQNNATLLLRIYIYSHLASKQVVFVNRLNDEALNWIFGEIREKFVLSLATPGEMVGAIAGQSIGEPSTQMTLNTFHYAGVSSAKNVTLGVPRLNEIMNLTVSMQTPQVTIYLDEKGRHDLSHAKEVQSQLEYSSFKKFVKRSEIHYDPDDQMSLIDDDDWTKYADIDPKYKLSLYVLRFVLDKKELIDKSISSSYVCRMFNDLYKDVAIAISNEGRSGEQIVRIRLIKGVRKIKSRAKKTNSKKKIEEINKDLQSLKILEKNIYDSFALKGINGLSRVVIELSSHRNTFKDNEWVLYSEGSSFLDVLNHDRVDFRRTTTNNIVETNAVLGVEAARQLILSELQKVYGDTYINHHHLQLLADTMSHYGDLKPVSRYGICKLPTGPLMKASYETTVDILYEAAMFGDTDRMKDVSSNIIVGRCCPIGTGIIDVNFDFGLLDEFINPKYVLEAPQSPIWTVEEGFTQKVVKGIELNDQSMTEITASPAVSDDDDSELESDEELKGFGLFDQNDETNNNPYNEENWFDDPNSDKLDDFITASYCPCSPSIDPSSPLIFTSLTNAGGNQFDQTDFIRYGPRPANPGAF